MATYGDLKTRALRISDEIGNSDAILVAEEALHEALKYLAARVRIDALTSSRDYTFAAGDTEIPVFTALGFDVTDAAAPLEPFEMYVASATGGSEVVYVYRRFLEWKAMRSESVSRRAFIFSASTLDKRPDRSFTINLDNKLEPFPLPLAGEVLTLYYHKDPAPYADGTTPEVPLNWEGILVAAAQMVIEYTVKFGEQIVNYQDFFAKLEPQIDKLERRLRSNKGRPSMVINDAYSVRSYSQGRIGRHR